jgi:hypothetical protein
MVEADQTIFINKPERIWFEFRDNNGTLIDVSNPRIDIENPHGTEIISSADMIHDSTGIYYYSWLLSSTAVSTALGLWKAWPHAWYNSEYIHPDIPRYLNVVWRPLGDGYDYDFLQSTRRYVGDTDASDYRFTTREIALLIKDATDIIMSKFICYIGCSLGYTVIADAKGVTFSSTPTTHIADLIKRQVRVLVLEHYLNLSLSQPGIIDMGDMRISNVGQSKNIFDKIKDDIDRMEKDIKTLILRGMDGVVVKTYDDGTESTYTGIWRGGVNA